MPTLNAEGHSKEVYINDALPTGTNEIGAAINNRDLPAAVTLLASAARTASGAGSDVTDTKHERATALLIVLDVTAQSGTTPTLDVVIQAKIGSNYVNLCRFSQYGAATGQKLINVKRDVSFATEPAPAADPAVSTGLLINNHDWLDTLKVKYAIAGTTPSYTFSVTLYPVN